MKALWRRLPLLVLVAAGIWWWQSSGGPKKRALVWQLPPEERVALSSVSVELWQDGQLLDREQQFFHDAAGAPPKVFEQSATLPRGRYEAHIRLRHTDAGEDVHRQTVDVGDDEALWLRVGER